MLDGYRSYFEMMDIFCKWIVVMVPYTVSTKLRVNLCFVHFATISENRQ